MYYSLLPNFFFVPTCKNTKTYPSNTAHPPRMSAVQGCRRKEADTCAGVAQQPAHVAERTASPAT